MEIITDITQIKKYTYPVIAMGNFDGVHIGHKKLISTVVKRAKEQNGTSMILTYWPHSKVFFGAMKEEELLQTLEERLDSFKELDVDVVVVLPFSKELSLTSAEDFILHVLVQKIGIQKIIVGYDSVFGKDKKGNKLVLGEYGKKYNFLVEEVEPLLDEKGIVSSSKLRSS